MKKRKKWSHDQMEIKLGTVWAGWVLNSKQLGLKL